MQKHVNLVDLVKSFPTNICLQNLASIQKRTSPPKFDHLAEKSEYSSISNLSTKVLRRRLLLGVDLRLVDPVLRSAKALQHAKPLLLEDGKAPVEEDNFEI